MNNLLMNETESRPLFSVVVPIYNVEKYIDNCIESLVNQTYSDIEIILVDDGSVDNSAAICDDYQKKYKSIKVIHKENGGLVSARKAGALAATGYYVACVDGDDWISLDFFELFGNIVRDTKPDIVCCGYYEAYDDHAVKFPFPYRKGLYSRQQIEEEIGPTIICSADGRFFPSSLWAKVFKRDIYVNQQQLVPSCIAMGEDSACVKPIMSKVSSLYVLDSCLYYYRQNNQSITRSGRAYSWDGPAARARHLKMQIDLTKRDYQEQWYREIVYSLFTVVVSQYNRNERIKEINLDIKNNLKYPLYREALTKCHFKNSIGGTFRLLALKYRILWIIRLFHRIKGI